MRTKTTNDRQMLIRKSHLNLQLGGLKRQLKDSLKINKDWISYLAHKTRYVDNGTW